MQQQRNTDWRLTLVIRDDENLRRIARASCRALRCRNDGMNRRLIVAMLNRWWPGLAIRPWGIWDDTAMLMATNALTYILQRPDAEQNHAFRAGDEDKRDTIIGGQIVKHIFATIADVLPDDMQSINRLLMREAQQDTSRSELEAVVETMTGVPYSA